VAAEQRVTQLLAAVEQQQAHRARDRAREEDLVLAAKALEAQLQELQQEKMAASMAGASEGGMERTTNQLLMAYHAVSLVLPPLPHSPFVLPPHSGFTPSHSAARYPRDCAAVVGEETAQLPSLASRRPSGLATALVLGDLEGVRHQALELRHGNQALRAEVQAQVAQVGMLAGTLAIHIRSLLRAVAGAGREVDHFRSKYQAEVIRRKLLYNRLQELRGAIRVYCRCRADDRVPCAVQFPSDCEVRHWRVLCCNARWPCCPFVLGGWRW